MPLSCHQHTTFWPYSRPCLSRRANAANDKSLELGFRVFLKDRAGLARIGIEAEGEEFRNESAEVDLSVDNGIGLVFVGEGKRLRFLSRRRPPIGSCLWCKPHVDVLVDGLRKRLQRNDTQLGEFAVHNASNARSAATPGLMRSVAVNTAMAGSL